MSKIVLGTYDTAVGISTVLKSVPGHSLTNSWLLLPYTVSVSLGGRNIHQGMWYEGRWASVRCEKTRREEIAEVLSRRSTIIEVNPTFPETPHLKSSTPHPQTDFGKNQIAPRKYAKKVIFRNKMGILTILV